MIGVNPKTDFFFNNPSQWQEEYKKLRQIIFSTGLTEELKWGCPCYVLDDKNVVLIHGFKEYCAVLFMKGALIQDRFNMMIQQTENVQAARQMRFGNLQDILDKEDIIRAYVLEAIELEKSGAKVTLKKTSEYKMPEEFKQKLDENPALKAAFEALTPGRQRGYLYYYSQPKTSKTRLARIKTTMQQILDGKGLED